jgi:pimeloyl-ACP methyl ester carboxylesterase
MRMGRGQSRRRGAAIRSGDSDLCCVESLRLDDGRQLCVRRWRGRDPRAVVVLHGLLDSSEGWRALSGALGCSVVAFDLPGFGLSDPPARGSVDGYAQDIIDGLEILGIERFTLVGHSLGGAVAIAIAELCPDQVTALVLLAPVGFGRIRLAEVVSLPGVRILVQAMLPWMLSSRMAVTAGYLTMISNGRLPEPEIVDRVTGSGRAVVSGTVEAIRAIVDAGRRKHAFARRRVGYTGPVLALWGDRDRLVPPSHRDGVLAALPQARVELWNGMGHHALAERFEKLAALIDDTVAAPPRSEGFARSTDGRRGAAACGRRMTPRPGRARRLSAG